MTTIFASAHEAQNNPLTGLTSGSAIAQAQAQLRNRAYLEALKRNEEAEIQAKQEAAQLAGSTPTEYKTRIDALPENVKVLLPTPEEYEKSWNTAQETQALAQQKYNNEQKQILTDRLRDIDEEIRTVNLDTNFYKAHELREEAAQISSLKNLTNEGYRAQDIINYGQSYARAKTGHAQLAGQLQKEASKKHTITYQLLANAPQPERDKPLQAEMTKKEGPLDYSTRKVAEIGTVGGGEMRKMGPLFGLPASIAETYYSIPRFVYTTLKWGGGTAYGLATNPTLKRAEQAKTEAQDAVWKYGKEMKHLAETDPKAFAEAITAGLLLGKAMPIPRIKINPKADMGAIGKWDPTKGKRLTVEKITEPEKSTYLGKDPKGGHLWKDEKPAYLGRDKKGNNIWQEDTPELPKTPPRNEITIKTPDRKALMKQIKHWFDREETIRKELDELGTTIKNENPQRAIALQRLENKALLERNKQLAINKLKMMRNTWQSEENAAGKGTMQKQMEATLQQEINALRLKAQNRQMQAQPQTRKSIPLLKYTQTQTTGQQQEQLEKTIHRETQRTIQELRHDTRQSQRQKTDFAYMPFQGIAQKQATGQPEIPIGATATRITQRPEENIGFVPAELKRRKIWEPVILDTDGKALKGQQYASREEAIAEGLRELARHNNAILTTIQQEQTKPTATARPLEDAHKRFEQRGNVFMKKPNNNPYIMNVLKKAIYGGGI